MLIRDLTRHGEDSLLSLRGSNISKTAFQTFQVMKYTPASFVLTFFGLVTGGFACGGSSSSTSFLSAIGDVESAALKCDPGAAGGALALDSIAASACNQAQASYVGLQVSRDHLFLLCITW